MDLHDFEALKQYASEAQIRYLNALIKTDGNQTKAAELLGIRQQSVHNGLAAVRVKAARYAGSEDHATAPIIPGHVLGKRTVQYSPTGGIERVWDRQHPEAAERHEALMQLREELLDGLQPIPTIPQPKPRNDKLIVHHAFADLHIGAYSNFKQTGANWDLDIAETTATAVFNHMIDRAPEADTCVLAFLGDWLHYDRPKPLTHKAGHVIDASGSPNQMVKVGNRCMINTINKAAANYAEVRVVIIGGNHDPMWTVIARDMLQHIYANTPNIKIEEVETPYYAFKFGKVMLGYHHGDFVKPDDMPLILATEYPEIWGSTEYRYAHLGDKHHKYRSKEQRGCEVLQHPTLCGRNTYEMSHAYNSLPAALTHVYAVDGGVVEEQTIRPEMVL